MDSIRVALVGLGFGAEFAPIYLHHPGVKYVALCDANDQRLAEVGNKYGIERRNSRFEDILASEEYDAVHLVTPIPLHVEQTIAVLKSGKHCACTVPMATCMDDLHAIVAAQRASGKHFMMMETAVYTREFLFARHMLDQGEFGEIQFLRGAHYQDMENWPSYWMGLPPMHYATHAIAPLLALTEKRATKVHCFGSGKMRPDLHTQYGNPYPVETAIFQLEGGDLAAEVTRTLFHTARAYTESFSVYAERASFEWQQVEAEAPIVFRMDPLQQGRGRPISASQIEVPDRQDLLPAEIRHFRIS